MQKIEPFVASVATVSVGAARADGEHYVLLTEGNREMTAQANLTLRGVRFYLPTIYRAARISARLQAQGAEHPDVHIPLFPRTLFIAGDELDRHYRTICSTPGMLPRPVMRFGDQEAILPPREMNVIRYIEAGERECYMRAKGKAPEYLPAVGEEVRVIVDEVLGGLRGRVAEVDERGRITLLAEVMKRMARVKVTASQIEPVQAEPAEAMVHRRM
ncbi:transcription termination/antitermination protein NusG [Bradyrhizobium sp. HKCCYLR1023]|uniref:transcription termination/antitermination protein NusG n=1 Tax=Bradyrhizobium TaxID=374 RepID=UPI003EB8B0B7